MSSGRYFRGLTAYDVLGNIIPGAIGLIVLMGFLSSPPVPDTVGQYVLFIAIAFTVGAILQAHASKAIGQRESFDKTMDSVEELPSLQYIQDDSDQEDNSETESDTKHDSEIADASTESGTSKKDSTNWLWRVCHPFIGPLCGWKRPVRGDKLDDVILANRIWTHLVDKYEIPFNTTSYSVLYHVMSSRVDDISSPSRATRMQAIRNFHRGMWITAWYSLVFILVSLLLDAKLNVDDSLPLLGIEYSRSSYVAYWDPVWHLAVVAAIGVVVFWALFESTEEDYIEYLFADYAVAIGNEDMAVSFTENPNVSVSGDLNATFETQPASTENDETADTTNETGDT